MKEAIERLKALDERAKKYYWKEESEVVVKLSDVRSLIDFYESHKNKSGSTPNVQDITPEWDKIDKKYNWVAIDEGGDEFAFVRRPSKMYNMVNGLHGWTGRHAIFTGRYFDMDRGIEWTKTLSKRPIKE